VLGGPLANYAQVGFPTAAEVEQVVAALSARPHAVVAELLESFPEGRRYFVERGLLWLAKFGVIRIHARHEFTGP
jgi:hypothetical protein